MTVSDAVVMDSTAAQLEGQRRLAGLRRRIHRIRTYVACGAVTMFLAAFGTVYVQMATGHDPTLGSSTDTSVVIATTTDDPNESDTTGQASTAANQVAPVTTRQS
jgi:hypothetical protein